jgi:hypothetical protein
MMTPIFTLWARKVYLMLVALLSVDFDRREVYIFVAAAVWLYCAFNYSGAHYRKYLLSSIIFIYTEMDVEEVCDYLKVILINNLNKEHLLLVKKLQRFNSLEHSIKTTLECN